MINYVERYELHS